MSEDNSKPIIKNEDSFGPIGAPVFEPRLYIQRYCYVKQELAKHNVKSVVDFGSAECKISRFLVQIPTVERIALVDLDKKLLEQHMYSVRPLTTDYLNRKDVTTDVDIYHGSVTDLDKCIVGFEAVSMVEIIEHLVSDVLSAAVTMVFGQLQPRVVVVTTPNSDFNVLFPNFSGFRHWDHKFEWSQEEFKEWCDRVASRYGYSVDYGGVGLPPEGSEHLGMCSQAATFVRQREYVQPCSSSTRDCYELIAHTCYPCKEKSSLSEEEQFLMEVSFIIRQYYNIMRHETIDCYCEQETENQSIQAGNQSIEARNQSIDTGIQSLETGNQSIEVGNKSIETGNQSIEAGNKAIETGNKSIEALCPACLQALYQIDEEVYLVPLSYLMKYRKVREKIDTDSLKIFLENNGFKLTVDGSFIIIPEDDSDSDSDNDGEDEDNDSVDVRSNNTSECEEKNCVTSHEVENWD